MGESWLRAFDLKSSSCSLFLHDFHDVPQALHGKQTLPGLPMHSQRAGHLCSQILWSKIHLKYNSYHLLLNLNSNHFYFTHRGLFLHLSLELNSNHSFLVNVTRFFLHLSLKHDLNHFYITHWNLWTQTTYISHRHLSRIFLRLVKQT